MTAHPLTDAFALPTRCDSCGLRLPISYLLLRGPRFWGFCVDCRLRPYESLKALMDEDRDPRGA